ncbi:MAG: carbohydrate-binding domain-containing protein [Sporichthyaceae bacterium]
MHHRLVHAAVCGVLVASLAACGGGDEPTATDLETPAPATANPNGDSGATAEEVLAYNAQPHTVAAEWDPAEEVAIALSGTTASAESERVAVQDGTVTISAPGVYRISGTLTDGRIVVNSPADGLVALVLDNAKVSSSTGPALSILDADGVGVVLLDDTTNSLSDGRGYAATADSPSAALSSTADLTIAGTGTLAVAGNTDDGISSTGGLVIETGTIAVRAVDDAVRGRNYVVVRGGSLKLTAGGDGIESDNEVDAIAGYVSITGGAVDVQSTTDGLRAATDLVVTNGGLTVKSGGSALQGRYNVVLSGGTIVAEAAQDAVRSDGSVGIWGGSVVLDAEKTGVYARSSLAVVGGETTVNAATGLASAVVRVVGGTLWAAGSSAGALPTDSSQGWVAFALLSTKPAGTKPAIVDASGKQVSEFTATKAFSSILYTAPGVQSGSKYTAKVGSVALATVEAGRP